jgi:RimJ/RimL family protein N-acetyltransferase
MAWTPGKPVELETENYILRSLTAADITEDYVAWWNDDEIMEGLARPRAPMSKMQHQRRMTKQFDNRKSFHLGVYDKNMNLLVGFIAIFINPFHRVASTNVVIGNRAYWGKNIVLETRGEVIRFIFEELRMDKISGKPMARNAASVFNYKAQGFVTEGILRKEWRFEDGRRMDVAVFGLMRGEWEARVREGKA